ncbi:MAG: putative lipopolysaccharide heptosyltransferase III [Acidobacteria bacterium]|nr:putative lipopolysaccharide heptosyltransferase III [Acidobacteriota bacterium]
MTEDFWDQAKRVLLIRLRSIGDTVLMTPCLTALKEWRSDLEIDVLVESLSEPILQSHPKISQLFVLPTAKRQITKLKSRLEIIMALRARRYDIAFNLHGGSTAMFLTCLAGAKISVGYKTGRYSKLLSLTAPSPQKIWQKNQIHCVEQQLGLLKFSGVPINNVPELSLEANSIAKEILTKKLTKAGINKEFIVIHPSAAFASKQWETTRFIEVIEYLYTSYNLPSVIAVAPYEASIAKEIKEKARVPVTIFTDLDLSELMALISKAKIFLGNDSGPAHIAAAFKKPVVVIFGSSNSQVWHPWSKEPYRLLRANLPCIPCPGYTCSEFPQPECIKQISVKEVISALDEMLQTIKN